jgi:hypothetical protein
MPATPIQAVRLQGNTIANVEPAAYRSGFELTAVHGDAAHEQPDLLLVGAWHFEPHTVFKKFASLVAAVSLSVLSSAASSAASRSSAAS